MSVLPLQCSLPAWQIWGQAAQNWHPLEFCGKPHCIFLFWISKSSSAHLVFFYKNQFVCRTGWRRQAPTQLLHLPSQSAGVKQHWNTADHETPGKYLPADEALLTVPLNLLEEDRKMSWHSAPLLQPAALDPCPARLSLAVLLGRGAQLFVGTTSQTRVYYNVRNVYYNSIPEWKHTVLKCCVWRFTGES